MWVDFIENWQMSTISLVLTSMVELRTMQMFTTTTIVIFSFEFAITTTTTI